MTRLPDIPAEDEDLCFEAWMASIALERKQELPPNYLELPHGDR